jgi:hypothetical protein
VIPRGGAAWGSLNEWAIWKRVTSTATNKGDGFEELKVAGFGLVTCGRAETGRRRINCPPPRSYVGRRCIVLWVVRLYESVHLQYLLEGQNAGMASQSMAYRRASEALLCFLVTPADLTIANIRAMQVIELSYTENIQRLKAETFAVNGLCVSAQKINISPLYEIRGPLLRDPTVRKAAHQDPLTPHI